jgi:hypothetical protein
VNVDAGVIVLQLEAIPTELPDVVFMVFTMYGKVPPDILLVKAIYCPESSIVFDRDNEGVFNTVFTVTLFVIELTVSSAASITTTL